MTVVKSDGPRELGHALVTNTFRMGEDNWDLRFPHSARVYSKMAREDSQVTSVLKAVTLPIRRATWQLDPNGADAEVVAHVAEDLRLQVLGDDPNKPIAPRSGRVSWKEHLHLALLSLRYGVMFFEQVYEPRDGRLHLVKLAPRYAGTVNKINVARDGGLESIEQTDDDSGETIVIPVGHLVAYCHEPVDSTWTGTSVLRAAYKHWKLRDQFLRLEAQVLDRNGMGVPVYTGSDLTNDPKGDLQYGQKLTSALRSGEGAGAAIPAGAKLGITGVSGQLVSPREAIAYHDSMMARTVLAHFLNLEGKGGSYALAETQADLFIQSLQTISEWICDVATQHIVEDLVRMAFPDYEGLCPRVVCEPIAAKKEITAEAIARMVEAGVWIPDKDLEEDTRRRFSAPPKKPFDGPKKITPDEWKQLAAAAEAFTSIGVPWEKALEIVGVPVPETTEEVTNGL